MTTTTTTKKATTTRIGRGGGISSARRPLLFVVVIVGFVVVATWCGGTRLVEALPDGAGGCDGNGAAVRELHLLNPVKVQTGSLAQGLRALSINGQAYTNPQQQLITLIPGTVYDVAAVSFGGGGGFLRGALLRLACRDTDAFAVEGDGATGQTATVCATTQTDGAQGVTHRNNSDKTEVKGTMVVDYNTPCTLDVTVVDFNNAVDGSVYWHSQFALEFAGGSDPPTPPTAAPPGGGWWCFSGETLVTVRDNDPPAENKKDAVARATASFQQKRMDQLQIGDWVLAASAHGDAVGSYHYAEVYSFGHYDPKVPTEYLQIYTTGNSNSNGAPLEITPDHLLYRYDDGDADSTAHENSNKIIRLVPAGSIRVGDTLVTAAAATATESTTATGTVVREIRRVARTGAYAPLTTAGNLAVGGVLASNYVSRAWLEPNNSRDGSWVAPSGEVLHHLQHGGVLPYRVYCAAVGGCRGETYHAATGFSPWVMFWYRIEQWQLDLHPLWRGLFLMVLAVPAVVPVLVGMLLTAPSPIRTAAAHTIVCLVGFYILWKRKKKTKTNSKHGSVTSSKEV